MIAALLLAAADLPPDFPKGTPTTIEEVRRDPRSWDGQWVRIEGWMHRCNRLDCVVSERPRNQGMHLGFESAETFDQWIGPLLPAEVVVVARVDAGCLINICLDRAPHLRDPHVQTMRWNVNLSQEKP